MVLSRYSGKFGNPDQVALTETYVNLLSETSVSNLAAFCPPYLTTRDQNLHKSAVWELLAGPARKPWLARQAETTCPTGH